MADTRRSLSETLALLADNATGAISAQDLRDAVVTLTPDHGEISITSASATTISDTTSYFPVAGTYTLASGADDWDMDSNGQLRYIGAAPREVHVWATASFTAASNNQVLYVGISKNGTDITAADVHTKIGTGTDVQAVALTATIEVVTNDYVALDVRNTTSTANVTFETAEITVMGHIH